MKYIKSISSLISMLYQIMTYSDPMMRLKKSRFRQKLGLSEFEKRKIREAGILTLVDQIRDIILSKLNNPIVDGKQTPYYGNPIFKAMHATACCCRKCLFKWHRIPTYRDLSEEEICYVSDLIYRWIKKQLYLEQEQMVKQEKQLKTVRRYKFRRLN